jgi:hypothetical protein
MRGLVFLSSYLLCFLSLVSVLRAEVYHDWCMLHFSGPETGMGMASPLRDADGDGNTNVIEYFAATDPRDANSRLLIDAGPDPETVVFPMALDRDDVEYEVVVSDNLTEWSQEGLYLAGGSEVKWHLNGYRFVKVGVKRRVGYMIDSDQDGLDDFFEEGLVAADPNDAMTHIGEVHPTDDFDQDGTMNVDEDENAAEGSAASPLAPVVIDPAVLNATLASLPAELPAALVVHTPLR